MAWVRIDDKFPQHPKIASAGPLAIAMQVAGLCYCNRELTDGFIPRPIARTLLDWQFEREDGRLYSIAVTCGMVGDDINSQWVIDLLCEAGMWDEVPGGYQIHDYAEYQPTKQQVLAERDKKVAAGKAGGIAAAQARATAPAKAHAKQTLKQNPTPNPNPNPVPREEENTLPNGIDGVCSVDDETRKTKRPQITYPADFEAFWKAYPSGNGNKARSYEQWKRIKPDAELLEDIMSGLEHWKQSDRWHRGFVKAAETWLKDSWWVNPPPSAPAPITASVPPPVDRIAAAVAERERLLRREFIDHVERMTYGNKAIGEDQLQDRIAYLDRLIAGQVAA